VIAVSTPNHPLRLLGILAASAAFFAIVGGAIFAAVLITDDIRSRRTSQVAGAAVQPDVKAPPGMIALRRVNSTKEFEQIAGFAPFVPWYVPSSTRHDFTLSVSFPDDTGRRVGRIGFSPKDEPGADGITGPMVVLIEAPGQPGTGVDGELKRITSGNGRALVATIPCRDLVLDVQLYFQPDPQPGDLVVTPGMQATATEFLDAIKDQCAQ
jgi:hypothetical protein